MMPDFFERLQKQGIIPVLVIKQIEHALPLMDALEAGGVSTIEVTLRSTAALPAIEIIRKHRPHLIIGAGTVLRCEQAQQAVELGCQFLVSPGMDEELIQFASDRQMPLLAGAVTATEIMRGIKLGLNIFKFFPAEAMGGVKTMQALADPFGDIRFIPTGGINAGNLSEYLRNPLIVAVGGSWMARSSWIETGNWKQIEAETRSAISTISSLNVSLGG